MAYGTCALGGGGEEGAHIFDRIPISFFIFISFIDFCNFSKFTISTKKYNKTQNIN